MTLEQRVPLLRDLTCLAVGAGVFVHAALTGADLTVLLISAVVMAGPGAVQLWLAGRIPGGGLSSVPVSSDPPSLSASPSAAPSGGEPA